MRWRRLTLFLGAVLALPCAGWGLWPLRDADLPIPVPAAQPTSKHDPSQTKPPFDQSAFAANLWHTPPGPPAPATIAVPEAPKPLNVQLIGIINEGGMRKAALYDIETDRLMIIGDSESFRGHTIKSITDKAIELTDGRTGNVQTLTLAGGQS